MIITGLLSLLLAFLGLLLSPLSLLPIPEGVQSVLTTGIGYLMNGFEIIAAYTHFSYLLTLFTFVISMEIALFGYKVVMWIIRKIPFFNVS